MDRTATPQSRPLRPAPSPVYAAALSAIFPGLGHLHTRPSRAKWLIWSSSGLVAAGFAWALTQDRQDMVAWTVKPAWLLLLIILSLSTLVARAVVVVDAARLAGAGRTRHRWATRLGLVAVVVVVALPHLAGALVAWQQRQLVTRVFTAESTMTARPSDVAAANPSSAAGDPGPDDPMNANVTINDNSSDSGSPNGRPMISSRAVPRLTSRAVDEMDAAAGPSVLPDPADDEPSLDTVATAPTPSTQPEPSLPAGPMTWEGDDRLSIVMLGSDGGYDRSGIRTDTIIVLSIDIATGDAVTFSVPRNWENVPFPAGTPAAAAYPSGNPDLANTVYGLGLRRPDLFAGSDDPGGAAIKEAMAQTLGIPIHYFVMVDMTAVVDTIDLFGGIDLTVTEYINDRIRPIEKGGPPLDITVRPGEHHFDGLTALAYVRSRVQSWDYSRMARQRCVVGALIDQVSPLEVLAKFGPFTNIVADHVVTDIPLDRADELLAIAARIDPDRMQSVNFVPPEFPSGRVPLDKVRNAVTTALSTDVTTDAARSLRSACGPEEPAGG